MGFAKVPWRRWPRALILVTLFYTILLWHTRYQRSPATTPLPGLIEDRREEYPLLWKHIHTHKGVGGGQDSHFLFSEPSI